MYFSIKTTYCNSSTFLDSKIGKHRLCGTAVHFFFKFPGVSYLKGVTCRLWILEHTVLKSDVNAEERTVLY